MPRSTLLRLGEREKALPIFEMTDDPEALTQFIFRCRPRGVGVDPLLDCLGIVNVGPVERYPQKRSIRTAAGAGGIQAGGNPRLASGKTRETIGRLVSA